MHLELKIAAPGGYGSFGITEEVETLPTGGASAATMRQRRQAWERRAPRGEEKMTVMEVVEGYGESDWFGRNAFIEASFEGHACIHPSPETCLPPE
jgi:hypothetical protein